MTQDLKTFLCQEDTALISQHKLRAEVSIFNNTMLNAEMQKCSHNKTIARGDALICNFCLWKYNCESMAFIKCF